MFEIDPNSQSNLDQLATKHVHLELEVDFANQQLSGAATLEFLALAQTQEIVLDTAHLSVKCAKLLGADGVPSILPIDTSMQHDIYGTALRLTLPSAASQGDRIKIAIEYATTRKGGAIQFLTPEQTLGKKHPYLFTQCEEIHARSLFPCQDSPSVKIAYSANIRVPNPLTALMSAISTGSRVDGNHT
ncbi:Leucyl aminopeptidase yscIV, partial [Coemansia furcata]